MIKGELPENLPIKKFNEGRGENEEYTEPSTILGMHRRFPCIKHYGDISKLNGAELPHVDIITGGSPCQDLSVAGMRAGLAGERSSLFMEQIRVIKEMREATNGKYSRFMVWENVPGAFSSNKGEDFRIVLEETARIADKAAVIPGPPKGKWTPAGCIMADGWSLAWRIHDAQFWGVPQRRKRIALVADFTGGGAPEILFERKGLSRNSSESAGTGKDASGDIGKGTKKPNGSLTLCLNDQGGTSMGVTVNVSGTLRAQEHGHQPIVFEPGAASRKGGHVYEGICGTLRADPGDNRLCIAVARHVTSKIDENESYVLRRLTPLECERLQGYPDGWTDIGEWVDSKGKKHKDADTPRYKALGNSIALPFWEWMAARMVSHIDHAATMGSLFDGIGGFPLVYQRCGAVPVWASEIDEFCIAVTKARFGSMW